MTARRESLLLGEPKRRFLLRLLFLFSSSPFLPSPLLPSPFPPSPFSLCLCFTRETEYFGLHSPSFLPSFLYLLEILRFPIFRDRARISSKTNEMHLKKYEQYSRRKGYKYGRRRDFRKECEIFGLLLDIL